jgi:hypothetical protein
LYRFKNAEGWDETKGLFKTDVVLLNKVTVGTPDVVTVSSFPLPISNDKSKEYLLSQAELIKKSPGISGFKVNKTGKVKIAKVPNTYIELEYLKDNEVQKELFVMIWNQKHKLNHFIHYSGSGLKYEDKLATVSNIVKSFELK